MPSVSIFNFGFAGEKPFAGLPSCRELVTRAQTKRFTADYFGSKNLIKVLNDPELKEFVYERSGPLHRILAKITESQLDRFDDRDLDQIEFTFAWPVSPQVAMAGGQLLARLEMAQRTIHRASAGTRQDPKFRRAVINHYLKGWDENNLKFTKLPVEVVESQLPGFGRAEAPVIEPGSPLDEPHKAVYQEAFAYRVAQFTEELPKKLEVPKGILSAPEEMELTMRIRNLLPTFMLIADFSHKTMDGLKPYIDEKAYAVEFNFIYNTNENIAEGFLKFAQAMKKAGVHSNPDLLQTYANTFRFFAKAGLTKNGKLSKLFFSPQAAQKLNQALELLGYPTFVYEVPQ